MGGAGANENGRNLGGGVGEKVRDGARVGESGIDWEVSLWEVV